MNDLERVGRHFVRVFYDPPPENYSDAPIWLLGSQYDPKPTSSKSTPSPAPSTQIPTPPPSNSDHAANSGDDSWIRTSREESEGKQAVNGESPLPDGGWPQPFLDDFESRIWMTYRSGFAPIQKSQDPKAASVMSFGVKLSNFAKSSFTSDAGFGCMIRSGQCILANTLVSLRLGRGVFPEP